MVGSSSRRFRGTIEGKQLWEVNRPIGHHYNTLKLL